MYMPMIKKVSKEGPETLDMMSYCYQEYRDIYIFEPITDEVAAAVLVQLKYLDQNGNGDIHIYINSPGGSVTAGMAIYDGMKRCRNDVVTICTGMAASMGAFLLSSGTKGKRMATPEAEIMIHQPLGGARGQATEIQIVANHIIKTREKLNRILAENTGKSIEQIALDTERDNYLSAQEAMEYGIVDKVIKNR